MKLKRCLAIASVLAAGVCYGEFRIWTDVDGRTVDAEYVSSDETSVTIALRNAKQATLPLEKLSEADQDFLATMREEAATELAAAEAAKAPVASELADLLVTVVDGKAEDYEWDSPPEYFIVYIGASW